MNWFKIHYNKKSAKKHGWHPNWFAPYLTGFNKMRSPGRKINSTITKRTVMKKINIAWISITTD